MLPSPSFWFLLWVLALVVISSQRRFLLTPGVYASFPGNMGSYPTGSISSGSYSSSSVWFGGAVPDSQPAVFILPGDIVNVPGAYTAHVGSMNILGSGMEIS